MLIQDFASEASTPSPANSCATWCSTRQGIAVQPQQPETPRTWGFGVSPMSWDRTMVRR